MYDLGTNFDRLLQYLLAKSCSLSFRIVWVSELPTRVEHEKTVECRLLFCAQKLVICLATDSTDI